MTATERIDNYIKKYENLPTKELCEIYNKSTLDSLFNNYNANTKVYAMFRASEHVLHSRHDYFYMSEFDRMVYSPLQ